MAFSCGAIGQNGAYFLLPRLKADAKFVTETHTPKPISGAKIVNGAKVGADKVRSFFRAHFHVLLKNITYNLLTAKPLCRGIEAETEGVIGDEGHCFAAYNGFFSVANFGGGKTAKGGEKVGATTANCHRDRWTRF